MKIPNKSEKTYNAASNELSNGSDNSLHPQIPTEANPKTMKTDRVTLTNQKPAAV